MHSDCSSVSTWMALSQAPPQASQQLESWTSWPRLQMELCPPYPTHPCFRAFALTALLLELSSDKCLPDTLSRCAQLLAQISLLLEGLPYSPCLKLAPWLACPHFAFHFSLYPYSEQQDQSLQSWRNTDEPRFTKHHGNLLMTQNETKEKNNL